jgi:UDP-glucose:(heptosyl)LPS alpha-1,3-glucosyltransferase
MNSSKPVYILKNRLGHLGGLEKYTWRIANAFAKKGCHVTILTSDNIQKAHDHPLLHFEHLPCHHKLSVAKIQEFDRNTRKYLLNKPYHLIFGMDRNRHQTHLRLGNGIHRMFLKTRKFTDSFFKRVITPFNPLHRLVLSMEKEALESKELRAVFANSHMVKEELLSCYAVDPKKIHVIHNGVEWYELEKDFELWVEKKPKIAASLHVNPATYHFLFIGNGYKRKGLSLLLKALSLIKNEDFHLFVIGKDKELPEYVLKAKKLGLEHKITFCGQCSDVKKFYQLCDALVIPSFYDPFANVTVEALAMGLYVISSKSNGGHEILTPENGYTLETLQDPSCLAAALKHALSCPKTWIHSQNIRSSVKHLDFSHQTSTLIETSLNTL